MTTEERIHFVEVIIQNHMRVRRAHVFLPDRGVVAVSGSNRAGKTSFKRSLAALVGGDAEVEEAPRHRDAPEDEEAYIVGVLSDGTTLRRAFTGAASSPKGRLTAKDSEDRLLSQRHLTAIVGPRALRPMRFLELKGSERREVLMGFAQGLEEALERLRAEKARLEEERRPHNSQTQVLGRVSEPEGERPEPVDVSAAMEELRDLQGKDRERGDLEREVRSLTESLEQNENDQKAARAKIAQLEEALETAIRDNDVLIKRHKRLHDDRQGARGMLDSLAPVDDEITAVQERLEQADAVNASLDPWKAWERAQKELAHHRGRAAGLNDELTKVERAKRDALAGAELPFTALSFDDEGEVLIEGSPLSAASGMELCRLALQVAIADDPDLGVVFMNGNELDEDALQETHRLADEHDFQVIMDLIHSPEFDGEVRMVNGVASQETAEPAEAVS